MPLKLYKVDFSAVEYRGGTITRAVINSDADRGSLIFLRGIIVLGWRILIWCFETWE